MTNREVVILLENIANLLQLKGENIYKVRAYKKAAESIYHLDTDIRLLSDANRLNEISGVGKSVKNTIEDLIQNGRSSYYDELTKEVPTGLLEIIALPGVGFKTVKTIWNQLGIDNIDDLLKAAKNKQIRKLNGMGGKTEYNIIKSIETVKNSGGKATLGVALPIAEEFADFIAQSENVKKLSIVGSLRRRKSLIGDIDILIVADDYTKVKEKVANFRSLQEIETINQNNITGYLNYNIPFELIFVSMEDYYCSLIYTTGSRKHRDKLFANCDKRLLKDSRSEEEVYNQIGLSYIPPELREDEGELEAAKNNQIPKLVSLSDIKGDLHLHSDWSDGASKIEDMVESARLFGLSYIAITDHSKSLPISGGLNEDKLKLQGKVIDSINEKYSDIKILKGIEVDILKDGSLDFDDDILRDLDIVVASVHSNFNFDKNKQTERIITAINNKHVKILGHLTGRLLSRRSAYELDIDEILQEVKRNKVILEINAHPDRLDIDEITARKAKELGIKIAINSDAHHKNEFYILKYGVMNARRGWLEPQDVVNTWDIEKLINYIKE
ncbi:DNA-dependent DNA polymerase family X [Candidatus Syntrophocurvum alkaliphilum]|uniref:DNA-directed DNA polymerase n=1 Tax=Candidatus Syntrophocurvum alkaliphilum TaxID=2293317 RepID=A0A6I6DFI0_9FIRM|nr:DNA polymerase/3'-5' exonuclease PolX [Candidatus Syntrophocurvum alkaliphilum]QGT99712.1 DNA-dependent DNA polymerase family X [Candidatus Syntrophocurvum alkaliphilum]